ncbi:MAG: undecaprenyl/decaprenyl-phosphate alpha-N-acetylglucosaminyl 1-phosphate transferase [bacterium]|nr:undecaprenyl/decaprenyl-phosphate alpha-N-acetylglucosaminyl 1-phosphate transferase [bacterium]
MEWWALAALLLLSGATSWVLTPVVLRLCRQYRTFDTFDERKVHTRRVPRLGGVAIFCAVSLGLMAAQMAAAFELVEMPIFESSLMPAIYIGLCGFFFIGFADDLSSLPALPRLFAQLVAATVTVLLSGEGGVRITAAFGQPLGLSDWAEVAITVVWIVGVANTFNWIDGLDGLASGVACISAMAFLTLALLHPALPYSALTAAISAVLVGALLGFLRYNFFPARIFLGDGGAFSLGYLLAVISVVGLFKQAAVISFAVPLTVLALPIFDTAFAILRRIVRGKSPFTPDAKHIHHRMLALLSRTYRERLPADQRTRIEEKYAQRRAHRDTVLWLYGVCIVCACVAIALGK